MRSGIGAWKRWPRVAVAAGGIEHRGRNDFVTVTQHQPVNGTHELRFTGAPAHALGDGQRIQRLSHHLRQQIARRGPGLHARESTGTHFPSDRARAPGRQRQRRSSGRRPARRAWVAPMESKAAVTGGPRRCSCWSRASSERRLTMTARRRGVAKDSTAPCSRPSGVDARNQSVAKRLFQRAQRLGGQFFGPKLNEEVGLAHAGVRRRAASGSPAPRGSRSSAAPRRATACARAGCNAGAR